jgi:butyryl-CoA dehydrogenase
MDLELTEEQRLIQQTARDFALREVLPLAARIDEEHRFPAELVRRMGELGFLGIAVPEEWGGAGADTISYVLALEEICRACASTGIIMSVNNSLVCDPLLKFGTDAQRTEWLRPLASGAKLGCYALSEPDAGSDAAAQKTTAVRGKGGPKGEQGWLLNGTKNFITNGPNADVCIVFAMTTLGQGHKGISVFIVPLDSPGCLRGVADRKLGIRAAPSCQLFFTDCWVPQDALLGREGEGFKIAMTALDGGRIGVAAQALGIARASLEDSLEYAKERSTFGKPIAQHQAIQFKLADMVADIEAARVLIWRAASLKDRGVRHTAESSMAKVFASEVANRAAKEAVQIFGGYGYLQDYPVERHFRDAKITEIYEGTSEIQRLVIASHVLKDG